jgi:hypothetical protein
MADANIPHQAGPAAGHELSDLSPRNISFFGIGLAALIVFALIAIYGLMVWLRASAGRRAEPPSPLSIAPQPIPGPQLLVQPGTAMKTMRQQESARLKSYGWIDQENGIVHIPIERAIEMLAEKGLPTRPGRTRSGGESRGAKEADTRPGERER